MLEVEGHVIAQSKTIERFLSRRLNLSGLNEMETAKIDMVCEEVEDIRKVWQNISSSNLQEENPTSRDIKQRLLLLENFLSNSTSKGQYCTGKLSLADLSLYRLIER